MVIRRRHQPPPWVPSPAQQRLARERLDQINARRHALDRDATLVLHLPHTPMPDPATTATTADIDPSQPLDTNPDPPSWTRRPHI